MSEERIGIIADTHGLVRPEAVRALACSSMIIHAGDVGNPQVLDMLSSVASVIAVRGNVDKGAWGQSLPLSETVQIGQTRLYVIHELSQLDLDPMAAGFGCVIFGHSHQPSLETRNGVLFLNPGSAGPRRFRLPVSVAIIHVKENALIPRLVELETG